MIGIEKEVKSTPIDVIHAKARDLVQAVVDLVVQFFGHAFQFMNAFQAIAVHVDIKTITGSERKASAAQNPRKCIDDSWIDSRGNRLDILADHIKHGSIIDNFSMNLGVISHIGKEIGEEIRRSVHDIAFVIVIHVIHALILCVFEWMKPTKIIK